MADTRSILSKTWDQVNLWDSGRTWKNPNPVTKPTPAPVSTPSYNPSNTSKPDTSAFDKQIEASNKAIEALRAQVAAQPKLPMYDVSAAWARAQKGAENVVNPVYLDKLNQYLEKARLKRTQTEQQTTRNKQQIQSGLTQSLEDVATQRVRTNEDTDTALQESAANEATYQEQAGTQFDRARDALLGEIANSGLTTSGIGRQQESQAIADRNKEEADQTRRFTAERKATETLRTRTFEDLGKTETRVKAGAESKIAQEDIDLKNFIDNASLEEKEYRTQNEAERLGAVASASNDQYSIGIRDFISGLMGSGARAQDIALAQQVYGT